MAFSISAQVSSREPTSTRDTVLYIVFLLYVKDTLLTLLYKYVSILKYQKQIAGPSTPFCKGLILPIAKQKSDF